MQRTVAAADDDDMLAVGVDELPSYLLVSTLCLFAGSAKRRV